METINCIFCGSPSTPDPIVIRENGFDGHQCGRCQLIYVSPRPSAGEIVNLYSHDEAKTNAAVLQSDEYNRRLAARHALRMLRSRKPGGSLLEIGAGMGFFCEEARAAGYSAHAIELNHTQAGHIRGAGIAVESRPLSEAFPEMKFDVIYHCDVLSHFTDPVAEFRAAVNRLNPGGVVMFETGNFGDVHPRYYRWIKSFQYPDHLFFFSESSLRQLLDRSGLKTVKMSRYSRLVEMMIQRKLGRSNGASPAGGPAPVAAPSSRLKKLIRHALVYNCGAILPPKQAPQTLIVIASPVNSVARN